MISAEQQEAYYRQHPQNVIRLIVEQEPSRAMGRRATATRARATSLPSGGKRASSAPRCGRHSGSTSRSSTCPGIGRKKVKGFIGAVRLHDYAERKILPHEKVLKGPLEDRILLTEATSTQFEYIWSLYQDRAYVIDNILDEQEKEPPSSTSWSSPSACGTGCGGSPTRRNAR